MPHDRKAAPRIVDQPAPGFFRMSLVKSGWAVPCRIEVWRTVFIATIDGEVGSLGGVEQVWHYAERITEAEYYGLLKLKDRMRHANPDHPALHPRRPIDPKKLKPIIPGENH